MLDEGSGLNGAVRCRPTRESDGVVVSLKLGSAGGGKDSDLWRVFEADEVGVIGDEPANT